MGRGAAPISLSPSLLSELRDLDVSLYDPPVALPRVPVVTGHGTSQRVTLGFADRRARARFLGSCTTEVAERCRGGASAACALAVARFEDEDGGGGGGSSVSAQAGRRRHEATQVAAGAGAAAGAAPMARRRPWWARMLLLPGPRDGGAPGRQEQRRRRQQEQQQQQRESARPRARCEAEAARACLDHARAFCRAAAEEAAVG